MLRHDWPGTHLGAISAFGFVKHALADWEESLARSGPDNVQLRQVT